MIDRRMMHMKQEKSVSETQQITNYVTAVSKNPLLRKKGKRRERNRKRSNQPMTKENKKIRSNKKIIPRSSLLLFLLRHQ